MGGLEIAAAQELKSGRVAARPVQLPRLKGEKGCSSPGSAAKGAQNSITKIFMTNEHKAIYDIVRWINQTWPIATDNLPTRLSSSYLTAWHFTSFLPARRYASAGTSYGPVSVFVCLSQVVVLSKRLNESSLMFLAGELRSPALHCVERKFGCPQK